MNIHFIVGHTFIILTIFTIVCPCNADTMEGNLKFISPRNLQNLLMTEENVVRTVNKYIANEDIRLRQIKEYVKTWKREHEFRANNIDKYFKYSHDGNGHQRDEKFSLDWQCVREKIEQKNASVYECFKIASPSNEDDELASFNVNGVQRDLITNFIAENFVRADINSNMYQSTLKSIDVDSKNLYNLMVKRLSTVEERREQLINVTRLCSNPPPIFYGNDLRCRYNFQNDPFLRIAPLKEEIISSDPKITIFREVLYASEMKKLIKEGKSRIFKNAKERNRTDKIDPEDYRREVAFLGDEDFIEINTITRRTRDITGRQENFVQPWQITFYEIGAYFPVHSDLDHVNEKEVEEQGRRMATVSFILNNAETGGTTIFPSINVTVAPNVGDAVMWYNVREDGTEDVRILHAVCPITMGHRWEIVKRINQKWMRRKIGQY